MDYSKLDLKELLEFLMYHKCSDKFKNKDINPVYQEILNRFNKEENKTLVLSERAEKKLYIWLKNKVGYDFLNDLIQQAVNYITGNYSNKHSYFVLDNLPVIKNIIDLQINDSLLDMNKEMSSVSLIDKYKTEELFVGFLKKIDTSLEWLNIYYDARNNGNIVYLNDLTEEDEKKALHKFGLDKFEGPNGCVHINGEQYIWLTRENTTEDFSSLVHEFMHYIVDLKNNPREIPHILVEFPSIFYELYSHKFLLEQGFAETELNLLKARRMNDSLYGASNVVDIFNIIKLYLINGRITERMLIERNPSSKKLKNENLISHEFKLKEWEIVVEKLINMLDYVYFWYPYIICTYFSNRALENTDDYLLIKMKYITENFSSLNVYDALSLLNVPLDNLGIIPISYGNELK